ncbi:SDR family NAD(P)-dependent oxidoreductase [Sphingomonas mucosissima]|uniref:3-oxoacyl-[acyl-carrier-protein] reductase FabG n=1 Tax=Sphingomonas mucosissima TaxID=370959 RepID=A0A245ZSA8_9SPHN|nr:SDR family NAD(P)-dependent oxidoreductase [Sphingomonas mucosissima]OWK32628.1 3-oxoacyl-[acyl-carrier-protein] reductase FabG [Sphingomonas mucosissima]
MRPIPAISARLDGAGAIVTGAGSGMGRATAILLARAGASVAVTDVRLEPVQAVVEEIASEGLRASAWTLDVADPAQINSVAQEVAASFGDLSIIVNNAGISANLPIDDPSYDDHWDRHISVLLTAQQRLIRAALPHLRRAANPRIVNIASTEGLGATAGFSAYSAAKAGVIGLTRSLAVELGNSGITVNCICPGPVETGMTQAIPGEAKQTYAARRTALRRYGLPEEVAFMTASLCAPAASFVTGAIIPVDGGLMARNA